MSILGADWRFIVIFPQCEMIVDSSLDDLIIIPQNFASVCKMLYCGWLGWSTKIIIKI